MKVLSREQLLLLHSQLINRYGGTHGIRDEGLLDSALSATFQGFGDYEFYPTVTDKAVRLGYGLVVNHPFHDGNKRIGALAMLTYYYKFSGAYSYLPDRMLSILLLKLLE